MDMQTAMAKDPVCGMDVDRMTTRWTSEYNGQTYYFCAPGCKKAFDKNPEEYLEQPGDTEGHEHHGH